MPKVKQLNGSAGQLGGVVELRELTVGQWLALQGDRNEGESEQEASFRLLSQMLHVDGEPIGWDRLSMLGIGEVQPMMEELNAMMGLGEEPTGNA